MPKNRFEAEDDGIDVIIDCTGVPGALEAAIPWTKMGGLSNILSHSLRKYKTLKSYNCKMVFSKRTWLRLN